MYRLYLKEDETCGMKFGIKAALAWADNFEFQPNVDLKDQEELKSYQGRLISCMNSIHEKDRDIRLDYYRVLKYVPWVDPVYDSISARIRDPSLYSKRFSI